MIDQATGQQLERDTQSFLQDIKRAGSIYDRNVEDMKKEEELFQKTLDENLNKTRTQVQRNVFDVEKQANDMIASYEKVGALKGFGRSSGYTQ